MALSKINSATAITMNITSKILRVINQMHQLENDDCMHKQEAVLVIIFSKPGVCGFQKQYCVFLLAHTFFILQRKFIRINRNSTDGSHGYQTLAIKIWITSRWQFIANVFCICTIVV